jgi:hypothetical protein
LYLIPAREIDEAVMLFKYCYQADLFSGYNNVTIDANAHIVWII